MIHSQETRVVLTSSNDDGNKPSEFSTNLLKPLNLTGNWQVALSEITIPKCPINFDEKDCMILETFVPNGDVVYSRKVSFLPENIFSHEKLITRIHEMMKKHDKSFHGKIEFNDKTFKLIITLHRGERIIFSPRLSQVLSLEPVLENTDEDERRYASKYCVDIRLNFWNLYVYSNLNKAIILGEKLSPLLQTLSLESLEYGVLTKSYNPPVFLPIARHFIPSISIKICDEIGRPVRFSSNCSTVCKLIFMKDGL